jgi:hypothetical protein
MQFALADMLRLDLMPPQPDPPPAPHNPPPQQTMPTRRPIRRNYR